MCLIQVKEPSGCKECYFMREDLMPGDLVEVKGSATKEVLTNECDVLQGKALLWQGKRGRADLI